MNSDTHPSLPEVATALRLTVGRLSRRMRQESSMGHGLTQIGILTTLDRSGPTTLGELANAERVAPPTITKAIASLIDDGFVEKRIDPDDRRIVRAELTRAGQTEVGSMRNQSDAWLAKRLAALTDDELTKLADIMPTLATLSNDEDRS